MHFVTYSQRTFVYCYFYDLQYINTFKLFIIKLFIVKSMYCILQLNWNFIKYLIYSTYKIAFAVEYRVFILDFKIHL